MSNFKPLERILQRAVTAATLVLLAGCGHDPVTKQSAVPLPEAAVKVQAATQRSSPRFEPVVGTLQAERRATLEAKVSGRITAMPVRMGQVVKGGELLVRLEAPEIQARLQQAQAALDQAQREWKRISSLYEQQATTRADYDTAEARLHVAEGGLAEARAMMAYVEVAAPFDGVVSRKYAEVGDQASPGKALLNVEDFSSLQVQTDLPEALGNVELGSTLQVEVDGVPRSIRGEVVEQAPAADPDTRTVRVKLRLERAPGLKPGQFARVLVPLKPGEQIQVPRSAVVQRGQLEIVFVAEAERAVMHLVRTGRWGTGEVEILAGLRAGQAVVVEGAETLTDGQPVKIQ